jgi:ABC-type uncharacterized transport system substrate-binding protein
VRRREFSTGLGSAAAASLLYPFAVRAEQPDRIRRIGFLHGLAENDPEAQARITAFRQGLDALGWVEDRNIHIDHRFGGGDAARIQANVAELVSSAPDLIVGHSTPVIVALKKATSSIPIVFAVVNDPVGQDLITSLAHPGGNITGFTFIEFQMIGKWLEMLKEVAPDVIRAAVMFNPETGPYYHAYLRSFETVPRSIAVEVAPAPVRNVTEVEEAVAALKREPGGGLIAAPDPFNNAHRALIMTLAQRHRLPVVYGFRQFVEEGGLMSYGPDTLDIVRRSALYVDRILKGAKPANLPAQAPTKFEMVVNLKTAKALGLAIPETFLARADQVIE